MATASDSTAQNSTSATELLAFLIRLTRPGARLRISTDGAAIAAKPAQSDTSSRATPVAAGIVQAARAAGYVMTIAALPGYAGEGPCEVLSPAGRAAVRAALMARPVPPDSRRQKDGRVTRRDKFGDNAAAQRSPERLTLVEQLGLRRNARNQPLLHETQVAAALRFALDFNKGHMLPRVTARWSADAIPERRRRGAPGAGVELADSISAAQARARAALSVLSGSMADLAIDVCCYDRGLESIEAARHWPRGAARVVLGLTLERLAEHYGMVVKPSTRAAATRQWGEHGFKPSASAWLDRDDAR